MRKAFLCFRVLSFHFNFTLPVIELTELYHIAAAFSIANAPSLVRGRMMGNRKIETEQAKAEHFKGSLV